MSRRLVFKLLAGLILLSAPAGADDLRQTQEQLEQIRTRIEKAEADLGAQKKSQNDIGRDLALINGQLQRIDDRIARISKEQQRLKQEQQQQQQQLEEGRARSAEVAGRLEQRLVTLYKEGDTGMLKILFSAESPTELIQQYHYLTRVMENDRELLGEYRQIMTSRQRQLDNLSLLQQQQETLLRNEQAERQEGLAARQLQNRLLRQAQKESRKLQEELTQLQEDANKLATLLEQLQAAKTAVTRPLDTGPAIDFARERGRLIWPVDGTVLIRFGTQRDPKLGTLYESNGLEIGVRPGSDVRAVANGRVVYADFFKGYGNLLIINHEGDYHSLYAQLERITKRTGDLVATAEVVGRSGLDGRESIYFEIRHKGAPVDPLTWLRPL